MIENARLMFERPQGAPAKKARRNAVELPPTIEMVVGVHRDAAQFRHVVPSIDLFRIILPVLAYGSGAPIFGTALA